MNNKEIKLTKELKALIKRRMVANTLFVLLSLANLIFLIINISIKGFDIASILFFIVVYVVNNTFAEKAIAEANKNVDEYVEEALKNEE